MLQETVVSHVAAILSRKYTLHYTRVYPATWGIMRQAKQIPQSGALHSYKVPSMAVLRTGCLCDDIRKLCDL